jgi:hypothetical protein
MLRLVVGETEVYDEEKNEFSVVGGVVLEFEHSLLALSKWESKYKKPFLSSGGKTLEETFGYLEAMLLTPGVDLDVLRNSSTETLDKIQEYIESSESATTFGEMPERRGPGEIITSELIYYWLVAFNIPFECEKWHLNRLFSLIRICNLKNSPPKKMSKSEIAQRNRELNAKRKEQLGTRG